MHKQPLSVFLLGFLFCISPLAHAAPQTTTPQQVPAEPYAYLSAELPQSNTLYMPIMAENATDQEVPLLFPIMANHAMDKPLPSLTRLIIAIHDERRDAPGILTLLSDMAGTANSQTLIITPHYMTESDLVRLADKLPTTPQKFARWRDEGWGTGEMSQPITLNTNPQRAISSFTVLDIILAYATQSGLLPNLHDIVFLGLGRGAVLTQLYAASGHALPMVKKSGITPSFLVIDAPYYLYPTASRYVGAKHGFSPTPPKDCPTYNDWPHGVNKMPAYASKKGTFVLKTDFPNLPLTYVVGDNSSTAHLFTDTRCATLAQGANALTRTQTYQLYLNGLYGSNRGHTHRFVTVKDTAHQPERLLGNPCVYGLIFGGGECPTPSP